MSTGYPYMRMLYNHAANTHPKIDIITGNRVLFYSKGYKAIGIACIFMSLLMVYISFFSSPWDDLIDSILFIIMFLFFLISGIISFLMTTIARVIVTPEGISVKSLWYFRNIYWGEINRITYSVLSEALVITSNTGVKVRIDPGLNGIAYLVQQINEHIEQHVFSKTAFAIINSILSRVNNKDEV